LSIRTLQLDDRCYEYLLAKSLREAPALAQLRAETASHPKVNMQIAPEQGQFMQMLVRLTGARRAIEVGVFTGYSSLAVMLAMPVPPTRRSRSATGSWRASRIASSW
jgi:caffeoyl-CoA O-methyltransferase